MGFFFKNDTEIHGPACREAGESRSYTEKIIRKALKERLVIARVPMAIADNP